MDRQHLMRMLLAILVLLLAATPVAASGKRACAISPSPVPYGAEFIVSVDGLEPLKYYDIRIDQDDHFGHHDEGWAQADSSGHWEFVYESYRWTDPRDALTVGVFGVHIRASSNFPRAERGTGSTSCSGEVVP